MNFPVPQSHEKQVLENGVSAGEGAAADLAGEAKLEATVSRHGVVRFHCMGGDDDEVVDVILRERENEKMKGENKRKRAIPAECRSNSLAQAS